MPTSTRQLPILQNQSVQERNVKCPPRLNAPPPFGVGERSSSVNIQVMPCCRMTQSGCPPSKPLSTHALLQKDPARALPPPKKVTPSNGHAQPLSLMHCKACNTGSSCIPCGGFALSQLWSIDHGGRAQLSCASCQPSTSRWDPSQLDTPCFRVQQHHHYAAPTSRICKLGARRNRTYGGGHGLVLYHPNSDTGEHGCWCCVTQKAILTNTGAGVVSHKRRC